MEHFTGFHLGTGNGHSIRGVASVIEEVFGKKINANWGGIPYRPLDTMHAVVPIAKNLSVDGWKSKISLREGIEILREDINKAMG